MTTKTIEIQEKVNSICNAYVAEFGQPPKSRYLLTQVDEFTSSSTAHRYFAHWKREYDANQQALFDKLGFSEDFNNALMKEVSRFTLQSEQRYKAKADEAKDLADSALLDLELVEERYEKQKAVISTQDKRIRELEKSLSEYEKTSKAIEDELRQQIDDCKAAEREAFETADNLRTQLAKSELKLENNDRLVSEVKEQNTKLWDDNEESVKALAEARVSITQLCERIEGKDALIKELQSSKKRMSASMIEGEKKLSEIEKSSIKTETALRTELKTVTQSLAASEVKLSELTGSYKQMEERFNLLIQRDSEG